MLRGRVVAELDPAQVTPAELGSYMTGARTDDGQDAAQDAAQDDDQDGTATAEGTP
jgi:hypothetical protein